MLRYMIRRCDVVISCAVVIPSHDIFYAAFRTDISQDFMNCEFARAIFDLLFLGCVHINSIFNLRSRGFGRIRLTFEHFSFGCVRSKVVFVGSRALVDGSTTCMNV